MNQADFPACLFGAADAAPMPCAVLCWQRLPRHFQSGLQGGNRTRERCVQCLSHRHCHLGVRGGGQTRREDHTGESPRPIIPVSTSLPAAVRELVPVAASRIHEAAPLLRKLSPATIAVPAQMQRAPEPWSARASAGQPIVLRAQTHFN
ncbi:hypothetical protein PsYK624_096030 [Phanerochaete sordida]|uniref:Uncharacterized protein n=1 Tax=Phanerochaete sordida TaxID=48140 RepID=A0A9P3LGA4_9APHY|nr:hypothetical protein PsYK624_096030 [Phanerochaete sordida]